MSEENSAYSKGFKESVNRSDDEEFRKNPENVEYTWYPEFGEEEEGKVKSYVIKARNNAHPLLTKQCLLFIQTAFTKILH
jgi:DNA replicative helicase MCM subunit Mcm2 (Cdc46/Mcm family)